MAEGSIKKTRKEPVEIDAQYDQADHAETCDNSQQRRFGAMGRPYPAQNSVNSELSGLSGMGRSQPTESSDHAESVHKSDLIESKAQESHDGHYGHLYQAHGGYQHYPQTVHTLNNIPTVHQSNGCQIITNQGQWQYPKGKAEIKIDCVRSLQIGENNKMVIHNHTKKPTTAPNNPKKKIQYNITKSSAIIGENDIEMLRNELGYKWKELARKLGFGTGDIDAIEHDNREYGLKEIIQKFLEEWRQKNGSEATLCAIADALIALKLYNIAVKLNKPSISK